LRLITRHFGQRFFTEAETFIGFWRGSSPVVVGEAARSSSSSHVSNNKYACVAKMGCKRYFTELGMLAKRAELVQPGCARRAPDKRLNQGRLCPMGHFGRD
jgi:hypothetical protein